MTRDELLERLEAILHEAEIRNSYTVEGMLRVLVEELRQEERDAR